MSTYSNNELEKLLNPKSIAIIGATANLTRIGGRVCKFLVQHGYQGKIYPINPKYTTILELKCYPKVIDIPENVDMAIITVRAELTIESIIECVEKNIRHMVIFSSGFAEIGGKGKELQKQLSDLIEKHNLVICGPNALGLVNYESKAIASFSQILEKDLITGPAAFITQSGAFGTFIISLAYEKGLGFQYFINSGNEVNLGIPDYMEYALNDDKVKVIGIYVEGIRDPEKFIDVCKKALTVKKPVVVVKVGGSQAGARAASSHTGSLAGSKAVYNSLIKQVGAINASDEQELLDYLTVFSASRLPQSNSIGVITMSGGAGIMLADKCEEYDLCLADLDDETKEKLGKVIPVFGSTNNPVDITATFLENLQLFKDSVKALLEASNVDTVVVFIGLCTKAGDIIANDLIEVSKETNKLIAVTWISGPDEAIKKLQQNGIPVFNSPAGCVKSIAAACNYQKFLKSYSELSTRTEIIGEMKEKTLEAISEKQSAKKVFLNELDSRKILENYGLPTIKQCIANSGEEAVKAAQNIGYPVVMKILSADIPHKTEVKGVKVNIKDDNEARNSYKEILDNARCHKPEAVIQGVLVQEMIKDGVETIVGVTKDSVFGPTIMFGLGGIFVETLKDVSLRVTPISDFSAEEMIKEIKGYNILKGTRNLPKSDINALLQVLKNLSKLAVDCKENISEIDINPLFVLPEGKGVKMGDALIVLEEKG